GRVKVLDFGLAKLVEGEGAGDSTQLMTGEGRVLGTIPYMSPEQVKGSKVDHRSDLFSLGTMLYEMATGQRPFAGASGAETMTAILRDAPSPSEAIAPAYPPAVHALIAKCLIKDRELRAQSAEAIRDELRAIRASGSTPGIAAPRAVSGRTHRLLWPAAAVLIGLAALYWSGRDAERDDAANSQQPRDSIHRALTQLTSTADLEEWPAWSPDGERFVCSQETDGVKRLVIHGISDRTVTPLPTGPGDAIQAAWSPDGSRIAFVRSQRPDRKLSPSDVYGYFFEGGDVWQISPGDAEPTPLVEEAFNPAWSPDGTRLAVDARWAGARRIWTTDAAGRNPRQITSDDSEANYHVSPSWSPDGRRIVYRTVETTQSDLAVVDLATGASWALTTDQFQDLHPVWSADGGAILFCSNRAGGINVWSIAVDAEGRRSGVPEQLTQGPGQDLQIAVSDDGRRVLFTILGINSDIWRLPVDPTSAAVQGPAQPLVASTREDSRAAWSPDGARIAFNSNRLGPMNIWIRDLTSGVERPLTEGEGGDYQPVWAPDGSWIAFFSSRTRNPEIWRVEVQSGELTQLTHDPALDTNPSISADGEWIAFQSDREGRKEVWLMRADGSEERVLTTVGTSDHFMRWTKDSRHLYCDDIDGTLTHRVDVATGEVVELTGIRGGSHMSLSPDEQSILDVT
ncbi:MAG TPA: protein kinase, partial [Pseudomonadales bacterium]|nr:protein kinase [Pseudomonadales bacterium]